MHMIITDPALHAIQLPLQLSTCSIQTKLNPCGMAEVQLHLVQTTWPLLNGAHVAFAPFAEIPARDVLRVPLDGVSAAAVLLMGCTDASCLLTTLAAPHPGLQHLTAVLNEANPLQLARTIFQLLLVAELDPDSKDDMQVLWEVWYCAAWSPATCSRAKPFIERLLHGSVPWMTVVRAEDANMLKRVWSSWLAKDKPSFRTAVKARQELKELVDSKGGSHALHKALLEGAGQQMVKLGCSHAAQEALDCQQQSRTHEGNLVQQLLQQDLDTFFQTGYLAPNYSGQPAVRARNVNATLLHPDTTKQWCFNVYCSPALCWGPFGAAELVSAVKTGGHSGLMARACIAHITQLVRNFQANTLLGQPAAAAASGVKSSNGSSSSSRVQLQVQLACMDALQLCLSMPLADTQPVSQVGPSLAQQQTSQDAATLAAPVGSAPPLLRFDAIESGLLADEVGLLPLLIAAGARLKPTHHARLLAGVKEWATSDCTLTHYISKLALCIPLSLTPTLLGLRLLTDLEADRPETAEEQEYTYRTDGFRELVWAPIPQELQPSPPPSLGFPQVLGGPEDSIEACLEAVAQQLCCVTRMSMAPGKRGLEQGTPQLLACLLASLADRTDMRALLDSTKKQLEEAVKRFNDQGGSKQTADVDLDSYNTDSQADACRGYAYMQQVLWALRTKVVKQLPHQFQLSFIAGIDILRSSLQQHAPQSCQPDDVPPCPGVKQLVVPLDPNLQPKHGCIRPVLVACNDGQHQQVRSAKIDAWAFRGAAAPPGVHIIDTWATKRCTQVGGGQPRSLEATVYLPADSAVCTAQAHMCLAGTKLQVPILQSLSQSTVPAPGILAQLLLPSTCACTNQNHPGSPATQSQGIASSQRSTHLQQPALRVLLIRETEVDYVVELAIFDSRVRLVKYNSPAPHPLILYLEVGDLQQFNERRRAPEKDCKLPAGARTFKECRPSSSAHKLMLALAGQEDRVQPSELQVVWPVATGLDETVDIVPGSYSSSSGVICSTDGVFFSVTMPKAKAWEVWPDDDALGMQPAPLDLSSLLAVTPTTADALYRCNVAQYRCKEDFEAGQAKPESNFGALRLMVIAELVLRLEADTRKQKEMDTNNDKDEDRNKDTITSTVTDTDAECECTRGSSIQRLSHFESMYNQNRPKKSAGLELSSVLSHLMQMVPIGRPISASNITRLTLHEPCLTADGERFATMLHLLLHPPIILTKAGRPVLPVTVLDVSMCAKACVVKDMDGEWFEGLLKRHGFERRHLAPCNMSMSDGCLGIRRMLYRHALSCQPTAAQQASLPDGQRIPYYYHSYLSFTQSPNSQYLQHANPSKQIKKDTASRSQVPAASTYLKYRATEIMTEISRCRTHIEKQSLRRELEQLLLQDGASSLPEDLQAEADVHLNWPPKQASVAEMLASIKAPRSMGTAANGITSSGAEGSGVYSLISRLIEVRSTQESPQMCACATGAVGKQQPGVQASTAPGAAAAAPPSCMQCGKRDHKLMKCGKCGAAQYCSRECQVEHWKQHKAVCKPVRTPA